MKRKILLALALISILGACNGTSSEDSASSGSASASDTEVGLGMGRGRQSGMMARHQASIPQEYAGITNPVSIDEESLARGAELYTTHCASCHGDGGMGDGPAGTALDPVPAPIAHTSQMLGDDYLFWRISDGGAMAPFNSAMSAWKATLDEEARWDVINYVQALGSGTVMPRQGMGGASFDPEAEAAERAEMLSTAVDQGILTQTEADIFEEVHAVMEAMMAQGMDDMSGNMATLQDEMLAELVNEKTITQAQADAFGDIHDRLLEAGLMQ